jgi:predicted 3-demethylubiquinone-9 3-methyltransferase (glyoxalase superfamily)
MSRTQVWVSMPERYKLLSDNNATVACVKPASSIFIEVDSREEIEEILHQLQEINQDVSFFYVRSGWVDDQFVRNKITVEVRVLNKTNSLN